MKSWLIFGGTFDPIHLGHLAIAMVVQNAFQFDRVIFLPCKQPVLKQEASASAKERLDMLTLALKDYPSYPFEIDSQELDRDSPSYMVTTLENYRQTLTEPTALSLLMGMDSFQSLPKWHHWQQIINLANLLVVQRRAKSPFSEPLQSFLQQHETQNKEDLKQRAAGCIYRFYSHVDYPQSSTEIREKISKNKMLDKDLPEAVYQYIKNHQLYI